MPRHRQGRLCSCCCQRSTSSCSVGGLWSGEEGKGQNVNFSRQKERNACVVPPFKLIINEHVSVFQGFSLLCQSTEDVGSYSSRLQAWLSLNWSRSGDPLECPPRDSRHSNTVLYGRRAARDLSAVLTLCCSSSIFPPLLIVWVHQPPLCSCAQRSLQLMGQQPEQRWTFGVGGEKREKDHLCFRLQC